MASVRIDVMLKSHTGFIWKYIDIVWKVACKFGEIKASIISKGKQRFRGKSGKYIRIIELFFRLYFISFDAQYIIAICAIMYFKMT